LFEVQNLSPFPGDELLWVSSDINDRERDAGQATLSQGRRIAVVLTSRSMVQAHLAAMQSTEAIASNAVSPEVWVDMGNGRPAVLPGFGEARRLAYQRRWQRVNAVLCFGTVLLLAGMLVTPTLQLRLRALDAVDQYTALQKQVAPLIQQREAYVRAQGFLQALPESAVPPGAALQIVDMITRALPDDTSLQSFQLSAPEGPGKPPKVLLVGQTGNAAALMQQLGAQPGFKDVKAPSAAVKPLGAIKESFSIELLVDLTQASGLASASPSPSMPAASSGAKP
jgi:general secretion pathway protein L